MLPAVANCVVTVKGVVSEYHTNQDAVVYAPNGIAVFTKSPVWKNAGRTTIMYTSAVLAVALEKHERRDMFDPSSISGYS